LKQTRIERRMMKSETVILETKDLDRIREIGNKELNITITYKPEADNAIFHLILS